MGKINSLFGINIAFVSFADILKSIEKSILNKSKLVITYANANTIRLIQKNKQLKRVLEDSDLIFNDGIAIYLAKNILRFNIDNGNSFNWTDCAESFLKICEEKKWSIFFIGGTDEVIEKAAHHVTHIYPQLKLNGFLNGYESANDESALEIINKKKPDILWVGMGTPKQELWIQKNKEKLNCKVIQSVGDLFTYFANEKVRGPVWMRKIGLEWLARTIAHPFMYFNRYIIGIPVFAYFIMKEISVDIILRKNN